MIDEAMVKSFLTKTVLDLHKEVHYNKLQKESLNEIFSDNNDTGNQSTTTVMVNCQQEWHKESDSKDSDSGNSNAASGLHAFNGAANQAILDSCKFKDTLQKAKEIQNKKMERAVSLDNNKRTSSSQKAAMMVAMKEKQLWKSSLKAKHLKKTNTD